MRVSERSEAEGAVELIKRDRVLEGGREKPADLWVAKMVDEELTADLPWTSGGGKEVFVCSGPPEEEEMSL